MVSKVSKVRIDKIYSPIWLKKQIVKRCGSGAIVYVDKSFIGKEAIIIIEED